jgi:hypothetical protein
LKEKQFYSEKDRSRLNNFRKRYYLNKKLK